MLQGWTMRIAVLRVVLWVVAMAMVGVCDVVRSELNCDEARQRVQEQGSNEGAAAVARQGSGKGCAADACSRRGGRGCER
jgi:hypothetical protein